MTKEVMQQALEALDSDHPDIQLRAALALREALAQEHAMQELARLGQEIEQEPTPWREMVVVTLVREGINKHRARELADHFAAQPEPEPVACRFCHSKKGCWAWQCYSCGEIDDVQKPALPAAQRPWQGLTAEEILDLFDRNNVYGSKWIEFARTIEAKLKERNK
jgi:hypothetical protein